MKAATDARAVALRTLLRIDTQGAYANLALRGELERSRLEERDRAFATDLVYGTTRLRRRLDFAVDRFLLREADATARAALRMGAYQLDHLGTPPHAAVSATVAAMPERRARGFVNAVLRKVAAQPVPDHLWPSAAVRLSYPDWIAERLAADLGPDAAVAAMTAMNEPAPVTERADGYVQDRASQWVARLVDADAGDRVVDLCAAPGGKATALAAAGARVVAADVRPGRIGLVRANAERLRATLDLLVADAEAPPLRPGCFDRVLLDAPCSGLGSLRRRADARWRIDEGAIERLTDLQRRLLAAARPLVRPGGLLVYSVCTLTAAEGPEVAATLDLPTAPSPPPPWEQWGRGAVLLPHTAGTDGMFVAAAPDLSAGVRSGRAGGQTRGMAVAAKVLTVSDGVVAGTREDRSGDVAAEVLEAAGFTVVHREVVADGTETVAAALRELTAGFAGLVATTGGTGFGPRDLTPEGTLVVLDREAPGLAEAMRLVSPLGRLSRQVAGTVGEALVLNLPGSSGGVRECLEAVLDVVPHALDLLQGGRPH